MSAIFGLVLLVVGIATLVFGIQVFSHDRSEFEHNHRITGNLANAITGSLNENEVCSPDEISKGFTIDTRTNELVPCNQLSRESIK